jgi:hypothetical protein
MSQTHKEHATPRGADKRNKLTNNLSKVERDIRAYELTLQGCSVRGVCEELGIKSTQTAFNAINRGKAIVIERGIDIEERRIDIDRMFKETLGLLAQTIRHQSEHGCETFFVNEDGSKSMKRIKGVDPRIAGELSRSLHRWSEFLGLMDRQPEINQASTTLIQLSAPADGASFGSKWSGDAVDVSPIAGGDNHPAVEAGGQPVNSAVLMRANAASPADLAQDLAQHPDSPTPSGRRAG